MKKQDKTNQLSFMEMESEVWKEGTIHIFQDSNLGDPIMAQDEKSPSEPLTQIWHNYLLPYFQKKGYWLVGVHCSEGYQDVAWIATEGDPLYERIGKDGNDIEVRMRVPQEKVLELDAVQVLGKEGQSVEVRVNEEVNLDPAQLYSVEHLTIVFAPEWSNNEGIWISTHLEQSGLAQLLLDLEKQDEEKKRFKSTPSERPHFPPTLWVPSDVVSRTVRQIAWGKITLTGNVENPNMACLWSEK